MLRPQQGIAERQAGGDTVVPQQGKRVARVAVAAADAPAAPEAALRRAVDRANAAPVIKILPVLKKQRQKQAVERIKFKQPGQMILRSELIHRSPPWHGIFILLYHARQCGGCAGPPIMRCRGADSRARRSAAEMNRLSIKTYKPIASVAALSERLAGCRFGGMNAARTRLVGGGVLDAPPRKVTVFAGSVL